MYKKSIKSDVNPLIATIIWLVGTYLFTIIWGILQILFEFRLEILKYVICIVETVWFGWFLINRVLTEYEAEINSGKLRISKILSRRKNEILIVAIDNITAICEEKTDLKRHRIAKNMDFSLSGKKNSPMYIVYNSGNKEHCIRLPLDKKFMNALKKRKTQGENLKNETTDL